MELKHVKLDMSQPLTKTNVISVNGENTRTDLFDIVFQGDNINDTDIKYICNYIMSCIKFNNYIFLTINNMIINDIIFDNKKIKDTLNNISSLSIRYLNRYGKIISEDLYDVQFEDCTDNILEYSTYDMAVKESYILFKIKNFS